MQSLPVRVVHIIRVGFTFANTNNNRQDSNNVSGRLWVLMFASSCTTNSRVARRFIISAVSKHAPSNVARRSSYCYLTRVNIITTLYPTVESIHIYDIYMNMVKEWLFGTKIIC